jgi:hypothetical protein
MHLTHLQLRLNGSSECLQQVTCYKSAFWVRCRGLWRDAGYRNHVVFMSRLHARRWSGWLLHLVYQRLMLDSRACLTSVRVLSNVCALLSAQIFAVRSRDAVAKPDSTGHKALTCSIVLKMSDWRPRHMHEASNTSQALTSFNNFVM